MADDFQVEPCGQCRLIRPKFPHIPQNRKLCRDCGKLYCSTRCLNEDFIKHHAEHGCEANDGIGHRTYYNRLVLARAEEKFAGATEHHAKAAKQLQIAKHDLWATLKMMKEDDGKKENEFELQEDKAPDERPTSAISSFEAQCAAMRSRNNNEMVALGLPEAVKHAQSCI